MIDRRGLTLFIIRCIWIVGSLILFIICLNKLLASTTDDYFLWSGLCLIPMLFPVGRFVMGIARGAGNVGSNYYDVDITTSGRLYVHNHRFSWAAISFVIAVVLCFVAGIFILPIYWLYFVVCTIIMAVRLFRR